MQPEEKTNNVFYKRTRKALLWMNLSREPFVVLYALLPFIIRKDLGASLLQISILTALRPVVPLFSFYWSANLTERRDRLRSNLIGAWVLGRLPFLFIPWIHDVWYLIFCCAVYELFQKSGIPALIEILKINLSKQEREKTYSFYFVLSFLESIALGCIVGGILDYHPRAWQFLCSITALLGLSSIMLQRKIPLPFLPETKTKEKLPWKTKVTGPWKGAWALLVARPDFARFQTGFMFGGFGLMLLAPALSIFYVDRLRLDHTEIATGRAALMGIGVVLSSYFWRKSLASVPIPKLTTVMLIGFGVYPLVLFLSVFGLGWFYAAFLLYGIVQSGSHLLWNLSGTLFAKEEDSSPFSSVNVLTVGLRGLVAPALGGVLCRFFGPVPVLFLGSAFCFYGAFYVFSWKSKTRSIILSNR